MNTTRSLLFGLVAASLGLILPAQVTPQESSPKVALVLGAGTAKATFEVGVVKYLYEVKGIRPDIICGSSTGALMGLKLAEGGDDPMRALERLWRGIQGNHDIFTTNPDLEKWLELADGNVDAWTELLVAIAAGPISEL